MRELVVVFIKNNPATNLKSGLVLSAIGGSAAGLAGGGPLFGFLQQEKGWTSSPSAFVYGGEPLRVSVSV